MTGHDLTTKRAIGVDPGEHDDERRGTREALQAAIRSANGSDDCSFENVVAYLAATPTRLVSIAVEDVFGMTDQVNVPGTVAEHPNWRRRWPIALEELASDQRLRGIAATLSRAGRGSTPVS
jgi:4-alpha-glucanotransferase